MYFSEKNYLHVLIAEERNFGGQHGIQLIAVVNTDDLRLAEWIGVKELFWGGGDSCGEVLWLCGWT